jgi:hypothetical protein
MGMACAVLLALNLSVDAADAERDGNIGLGQFSVRTHSLHNMLRLGQTPNSLYVIEPGDIHATLAVGYANVWNSSTNKFLVDGEWGNLDVRLAYAVNDRIEMGINLPFSTRQGGFLDNTIDAFHERFRFESQGRGNAPENETAISFFDPTQDSTFLAEGSSTGINDIPLFLVWHASEGDASTPAIRLKTFVTLPVGDESELEGTGEPVIGTGLMAAKRLGTSKHHLYGEIEYSYSDQSRWDGFDLNQHMFGATVIWEYRWSHRTSIVTQYNVVSGIAKDYDEWTNESHHVNLGIKRQLNENVVVEISLQENIFHYNTSADIGINAAVSSVF